jgi:hypothetical protein
MNTGFSNLTLLKAQLLAPNLLARTDWDAKISAIGLGVVGSFEKYCNRDFAWTVGAQDIDQGDRDHWYARRAPVAQFTKVELRYFRSDAWTDISGQPLASDEKKGLIHFGYTLGTRPIQFRVTYDGGFWWPILDPGEPGYPDVAPAEIAANAAGLNPNVFLLPASLLFAWQMQVRKVWEAMDKLGTQIVHTGSNAHNPADVLAGLDLVPEVERILRQYVRYQLT